MGVPGQDHVDSLHAAGHLAVHVEAVVRQHNDELRSGGARVFDVLLHHLLADAEGPVGNLVTGVGDRSVREGLADHGHLHAAALEDLEGLEDRLFPLGVDHVAGQEGKLQLLDQLVDAILAVGELPMRRHGIGAQHVHAVHHVLAAGLQRRPGALPGITAIKQQALAGAFRADRLDQRRHTVHAAHAAVGAGQVLEIEIRQGVGLRRATLDVVVFQEILAGEMGRQAHHLANADVDAGLAEVDRIELRVNVRQVDQRHLPFRLELQDVVLGDGLLRHRRAQGGHRTAGHGESRECQLDEVPSVNEHWSFPRMFLP